VKKRIHVNQHNIRHNASAADDDQKPVITVKTYSRNIRGNEVHIAGKSTVVYSPMKPLSCGAKVWIETTAPVVVDGEVIG
jgi:hypothetical protein